MGSHGWGAGPERARGQDVGGLVEGTASSDDPIAVDASSDLRTVPLGDPRSASRGQRAPAPATVTPRVGRVLTAISGIEESDHRTAVAIEHGTARVEIQLRLSSRARHPAEAQYRLPRAPGARLTHLAVCVEGRCREGGVAEGAARRRYDDVVRARPHDPEAARLPVAFVEPTSEAWTVWVAPIPKRGTVSVTLRYVAPAEEHGGMVRFRLPARGRDPRISPTEVTATAPDLVNVAVDGIRFGETAVEIHPWLDGVITGQRSSSTSPRAHVQRFPCGSDTCARVYVQAAPRTPIATDLALLLDTSPSMLGSPRNRVGAAVASLLAVAPPGSRVSAVAFATRPEVLSLGDPASDAADASAVAIETLVDASARELGRSTRLDRALERAIGTQALETTNARRRKAVVLLSDARVSAELSLERATRLLRRRRIPLFVANLGDQVPSPALRHLASETGGAVLTLGAAAEAVVRGLSPAALEERVLAVFQDLARRRTTIRIGPRTWPLGPLHAGQALTWVGPVGHRRARIAGVRTTRGDPEWLVDWTDAGVHPWAALPESTPATTETECDPHGPAVREGGLGNDDTPIALAAERRCDVQSAAPRAPSTARDGRGIPAETLLRSLRERVIPRARQCLRRDRAGRARHSVRAVYEFELAHREVESVRVSGEIEDGLRACLEETLDGLEVPTFTGRIVVTYPVYTEAEAPPPRVELRSEVAHDVDDAIGPHIELNSLLTPEGQLTP